MLKFLVNLKTLEKSYLIKVVYSYWAGELLSTVLKY